LDPAQARRLEDLFGGQPLNCLGRVGNDSTFKIIRHGRALIETDLETLRVAWERRFGGLV
jgi:hypothetical protein